MQLRKQVGIVINTHDIIELRDEESVALTNEEN